MRFRKININTALFESMLSLSILNVLNMVLPLVTLPFLIRVVGIEKYGAYSIVYVILQYGLLVNQYGFNYSTTQQVAQSANDIQKVNDIFNSTIIARLILSVVASLICGLFILYYSSSEYTLMYLLGLGIIYGDALNPVWLFQGMERMRYMTIINVFSKVLFTILIFFFIRKESDYVFIIFYNALGFIISGILSVFIALKVFKLHLYFPSLTSIIAQFKDGWYLFVSTLFMNFYRNSNVLLLSFFVSEAAVGMYSGAEKMIKAAQSIASPISNAFYPHFAKKETQISLIDGVLKLTRIMTFILLPISLCGFCFAKYINLYFLDPEQTNTITLMQIMSPVILIGGLNYILGFVGLVNLGENKLFTKIVIYAGVIDIVFLLTTVNFIRENSASWAMFVSEVFLFLMCYIKLKKIKDKTR